jgi:uncharacterized phage protein (TIGR01671 family)
MGREILFRAKRVDNGEWVYGYFVKSKEAYSEDYVSAIITKDCKHRCMGEYCVDGWYEINEDTLGQFTGLTDKNGKKIFEGDIVTQPVRETRKHSNCVIEFFRGKFQAHYKSNFNFFDRYYDINSYTKIIGDIYDDPELLEAKDGNK